MLIYYSNLRVDVKDLCQVKPPTGEESRFQLELEAAPGQRDLGILSLDKVAVLLQVIFVMLLLYFTQLCALYSRLYYYFTQIQVWFLTLR